MANELETMKAERQAIIDGFDKTCRKIYSQGAQKVTLIQRTDVTTRWDLGNLVASLFVSGTKYGDNDVEKLAKAWSIPVGELRTYIRFANNYTREAVQAILEASSFGNPVTWTHFEILTQLAGPQAKKHREKLSKEIITTGMTTSALRSRIKDILGVKKAGSGRKPNAPASISAGLDQIVTRIREFESRNDVWEDAVFGRLMTESADSINDKTLDKLKDAAASSKQFLESVRAIHEKAMAAVARVESVLDLRASGEVAEDEEVDEDTDVTVSDDAEEELEEDSEGQIVLESESEEEDGGEEELDEDVGDGSEDDSDLEEGDEEANGEVEYESDEYEEVEAEAEDELVPVKAYKRPEPAKRGRPAKVVPGTLTTAAKAPAKPTTGLVGKAQSLAAGTKAKLKALTQKAGTKRS